MLMRTQMDRFMYLVIFEFLYIVQTKCYICLTWSLQENTLRLKCLTSKINSKISFDDPYNQRQGYCGIPFPSPQCIPYYRNGSMYQSMESKETVFEVRGTIGSNVNGMWACHHGRNKETGLANVRIFNRTVPNYMLRTYVHLSGPTVVKKNEPVWLTCSSNVPLQTLEVTIYVNDKIFTKLTNDSNSCYSSFHNGICEADECQCSKDGRTYFIKHEGFKGGKTVSIECKMQHELLVEMSDCIMLRVIDIEGPKIKHEKIMPFFGTDFVELTCFAYTNSTDIRLEWKCFDMKPHFQYTNLTFVKSVLSFEATSAMNNKTCTCKAFCADFVTFTSLEIKVRRAPVLALNSSFVCNQSTSINISCTARGELPITDFGPWVHTINGYFIRHLNGHRDENMSTIFIKICSFEDEGDYICQAWTSEQGVSFWNNISSKLVVRGPPFITKGNMYYVYKEHALLISVKFYSIPPPVNINWFFGDNKLQNSTQKLQSFSDSSIQREMYGRKIRTVGYSANLSIQNYSNEWTAKKYSVFLQNEIGNITKYFNTLEKGLSGNKEFMVSHTLWILTCTGAILLLVTITLSTILYKHIRSSGNRGISSSRSIYYAAQPTTSTVHAYERTEIIPHYVDINVSENADHQTSPQNELEDNDKVSVNQNEYDYELPHDYMEVL